MANCTHATAQDHFRRIYFEAIDCMIWPLSERFSKPCIDAFANMDILLLNSIAGEEINDELAWRHSRYTDDLDVSGLKTELLDLNRFPRKKSITSMTSKSYGRNNIRHQVVVSKCYYCNSTAAHKPRHKCYPRKIIFCRKKNQNQAAIKHDTVKVQVLIFPAHTHKDFVDGLDVISIATDSVSLNSARYNNFGTFTDL